MQCLECENSHFVVFRPVYQPVKRAGLLGRIKGAIGLDRTGYVLVCGKCGTQVQVTADGMHRVVRKDVVDYVREQVKKDPERERSNPFPFKREG